MTVSTPTAHDTQDQLRALRGVLRELGSVLVCYSGGIDSAFVLAVAHAELGERAIGMTAVSPSLSPSEKADAARIAERLGVHHRFVDSHELERPGYVQNGPDRCFHCKSELYDIAEAKRAEWQLAAVVNGTNRDDLGDYRPGLEAAKNARVRSPLLEVGMTKRDVRAAAQAIGMDIWDKPAAACLASRVPYGTPVNLGTLRSVAEAESGLRALGFRQLRVRHYGDTARIEVPPEDLARAVARRQEVAEAVHRAGYRYVTLDLDGFRSGNLNDALQDEALVSAVSAASAVSVVSGGQQ